MNYKEYIGSDESGKGDIFGPLVVASVYTNPKISKELRQIGVKDSKLIEDRKILKIADMIKEMGITTSICTYLPKLYNRRYTILKNQVLVLKEMYEETIMDVSGRSLCKDLIIDKFSSSKKEIFIFKQDFNLISKPRAEVHTGVAAASILARAEVVKWFEENNTLLKGASDMVKHVLSQLDVNTLNTVAKLHFKSVSDILLKKEQGDLFP